jgi:hypothetical protein
MLFFFSGAFLNSTNEGRKALQSMDLVRVSTLVSTPNFMRYETNLMIPPFFLFIKYVDHGIVRRYGNHCPGSPEKEV